MRSLLLFLLLTLPSLAQGNEKYVPANDAQPLIRRDLIPLDVMSIRDLADHLAILADGPPATSPHLLRNRVQALTLSLRLAPAQPRAREILQAFEKGQKRPAFKDDKMSEAKRKTAATATWLVSLPKESEGHHLAQLLLDILQPITKEENALTQHDFENSPKRWKHVVARVDAFKLPEKPKPTQPKLIKPEPSTPSEPSYAVSALLTSVPMFTEGLDKPTISRPGLVKTSLVIIKGGNQTTMVLKPNPSFSLNPIKSLITKYYQFIKKPLPDGYTLNVNTNGRRYRSVNGNNLAAPIAMMLDAARSGRPLRRNTFLFADFREDGALGKPTRAWELILELEELGAPSGSRILVGHGLLEEMTALLVLQKAGFFTKYEVIEVSQFETARELFYEDGKPPEALASAILGYQQVREKALEATNLGSFLNLSAVETRLVKVRDSYPAHLSARMLATQSIRRPDTLSRFMLAQELDLRLQKIANFKYEANKTPPASIKETYKETREALDPLARLTERSDRELLEEAEDIVKSLNYLGRGASDSSREKEEERSKGIKKFQTDLLAFRKKLRAIYNPPK